MGFLLQMLCRRMQHDVLLAEEPEQALRQPQPKAAHAAHQKEDLTPRRPHPSGTCHTLWWYAPQTSHIIPPAQSPWLAHTPAPSSWLPPRGRPTRPRPPLPSLPQPTSPSPTPRAAKAPPPTDGAATLPGDAEALLPLFTPPRRVRGIETGRGGTCEQG